MVIAVLFFRLSLATVLLRPFGYGKLFASGTLARDESSVYPTALRQVRRVLPLPSKNGTET